MTEEHHWCFVQAYQKLRVDTLTGNTCDRNFVKYKIMFIYSNKTSKQSFFFYNH